MRWSPYGGVLVAWVVALGSAGCATGCPEPGSSAEAKELWARRLRAMQPNPVLTPEEGGLPVHVSVERFRANVSAKRYAAAFVGMMQARDATFDAIKINRLPENVGRDFTVGERFQGRYQVKKLKGGGCIPSGLACALENAYFSDYGMVKSMDLSPAPGQPYVLEYVYIGASPLAGSSVFKIQDVKPSFGGPEESEFEQVFTYQAADMHTERLIKQAVLRMHNRVVWTQASLAAQAARGKLLCSTVPPEDQVLPHGG